MADLNMSGGLDGINMPYSPEAEQAVLGAVIMEPDCLNRIVGILTKPEYFHLSLHRTIYSAMLSMYTQGAGSTITDEVPADSLALARSRQVNKPGWAVTWRAAHEKK